MNRTEMNAMSDKDLLSRYESLTETCRFWEGQRYIYHIGGKEFMRSKSRQAEFKREIKRRMKGKHRESDTQKLRDMLRIAYMREGFFSDGLIFQIEHELRYTFGIEL